MNAVMDFEAEYNNRARVPEHQDILARWESDSAAWREERAARAELGLSYADQSERTAIDIFWPDGDRAAAPVALFIHGGYWQALDRTTFSFLARGANAHGVAVALPSYDLCPTGDIAAITAELSAACAWLFHHVGRRFAVAGHSAGGHLTAEMLATDWTAADPAVPAGLVRHGLAISGVFDLMPLVDTTLNAALALDRNEARRRSPIHRDPPAGCLLDAVVGGDESDEFLRQSREMAQVWAAAGAETRFEAIPGANHFTVIDPLADPGSALTLRLVDFARRAAGQ